MKSILKLTCALLSFFITLNTFATTPPLPPLTIATSFNPNRLLLSKNYKVFVADKTVLNHPAAGFRAVKLPTVNYYKGAPGCYILCYSHEEKTGVYAINNTIFVQGQIRVPGHYRGRICQPARNVNKNISKSLYFKTLCQQYVPSCTNSSCWAGGDTGGWFGLQSS